MPRTKPRGGYHGDPLPDPVLLCLHRSDPVSRDHTRRLAWGLGVALLVAVVAGAGAQTPPGDPLAEARALVRAGKLEEAVAAYTRVLEANPGALEARTGRGRVLGWLQRFDEALADFDAVLAVTPRDADTRVARSRVLAYAKRFGEHPSQTLRR